MAIEAGDDLPEDGDRSQAFLIFVAFRCPPEHVQEIGVGVVAPSNTPSCSKMCRRICCGLFRQLQPSLPHGLSVAARSKNLLPGNPGSRDLERQKLPPSF